MSKIEKAALAAMKQINECRVAALNLKSEVEMLAYGKVPAGAQRDDLLKIGARAGATVDSMNAAENELATTVQALLKIEAQAAQHQSPTPEKKDAKK